MASRNNRSLARQLLVTALINLGALAGIFILAEIILHSVWRDNNPFLALGRNQLRIAHPVYTHTLKANFDGYDAWGSSEVPVRTNSLGFRDASARSITLAPDRKRIVFIGDSFTESLGIKYEESFVGRFAQAFPDLDVLNAGVSSYAPSVYYEKLKHYLDAGLKFDEAIVYIDVSDLQDEATLYDYDQSGVLQIRPIQSSAEGCSPVPRPLLPPASKGWIERASYMAEFFAQWRYSRALRMANDRASLQDLSQPGAAYSWDYGRASWTYNKDAACYGALGIDGAIDKAKRQMERLREILSEHGVALSVGVYPWPQQLLYDVENSRHAQMWREWCAGKCKRFFDHFPAFFRYKEKDPDFVKNLFFWGDVHFNSRGNEVLASDLIQKYRESKSAEEFDRPKAAE